MKFWTSRESLVAEKKNVCSTRRVLQSTNVSLKIGLTLGALFSLASIGIRETKLQFRAFSASSIGRPFVWLYRFLAVKMFLEEKTVLLNFLEE